MVVIDSLFVMDQFKAAERVGVGRPHTRDIAEVTAMAEAVLPKGSARISTPVRRSALSGGGLTPPARVVGRSRHWPFPSAVYMFVTFQWACRVPGLPSGEKVLAILLRSAHWPVCHCR